MKRIAAKLGISTEEGAELSEILERHESAGESHILRDITIEELNQQIRAVLSVAGLAEKYATLCDEYRYVDEIHKLHVGKLVKWIPASAAAGGAGDGKIRGGRVCAIKPSETTTNILCFVGRGNFITYNFNTTFSFQKLTEEEKIIVAITSIIRPAP